MGFDSPDLSWVLENNNFSAKIVSFSICYFLFIQVVLYMHIICLEVDFGSNTFHPPSYSSFFQHLEIENDPNIETQHILLKAC